MKRGGSTGAGDQQEQGRRRRSIQRPGPAPRQVIVREQPVEAADGNRHSRLAALLSDALSRRLVQAQPRNVDEPEPTLD